MKISICSSCCNSSVICLSCQEFMTTPVYSWINALLNQWQIDKWMKQWMMKWFIFKTSLQFWKIAESSIMNCFPPWRDLWLFGLMGLACESHFWKTELVLNGFLNGREKRIASESNLWLIFSTNQSILHLTHWFFQTSPGHSFNEWLTYQQQIYKIHGNIEGTTLRAKVMMKWTAKLVFGWHSVDKTRPNHQIVCVKVEKRDDAMQLKNTTRFKVNCHPEMVLMTCCTIP